jgi:hypothetical protein
MELPRPDQTDSVAHQLGLISDYMVVVGSQSVAIGLASKRIICPRRRMVSELAIGLASRRIRGMLLTSDVVSGPRVREVVDGPLAGWRSIGDLTCCNKHRMGTRDSLTSLRPACCSRQLSCHGISCGTGDATLCVAGREGNWRNRCGSAHDANDGTDDTFLSREGRTVHYDHGQHRMSTMAMTTRANESDDHSNILNQTSQAWWR